jgi:hypothetical protein
VAAFPLKVFFGSPNLPQVIDLCGSTHGFIEWTIHAVEGIITQFVVDNSGPHPDAFIFLTGENLDFCLSVLLQSGPHNRLLPFPGVDESCCKHILSRSVPSPRGMRRIADGGGNSAKLLVMLMQNDYS